MTRSIILIIIITCNGTQFVKSFVSNLPLYYYTKKVKTSLLIIYCYTYHVHTSAFIWFGSDRLGMASKKRMYEQGRNQTKLALLNKPGYLFRHGSAAV